RRERIKAVVRIAGQRFAEQDLCVLGEVGEREALLRPFQLEEVPVELDAVLAEGFDTEPQEDRCLAGVALVDETHMLRPVIEHRLHVRYRLWPHVCEYAAVGTFEAERISIRVMYGLVALDDYAHRCPFLFVVRGALPLLFAVLNSALAV